MLGLSDTAGKAQERPLCDRGDVKQKRVRVCTCEATDCHNYAQLVTASCLSGRLLLMTKCTQYAWAQHACKVLLLLLLLLTCGLDCTKTDKHHAQTVGIVRANLEPSSFVSVAKYSNILSGPLRSRMRFSYLKNVLCLVESGKSCQDCSRQATACCKSSISAKCLTLCGASSTPFLPDVWWRLRLPLLY